MAAKIDRACLKSDPRQTVWASEYNKHKHGTPLCPDRRCRCVLRFVPAYSRNINNRQVWTVAYFGLPANGDARATGHSPECRFNVDNAVVRLVAHSRELTGTEPLPEDTDEEVEYRLHILMEVWDHPCGNAADLDDELRADGRATGSVYVSSGRELRPYLNRAKAVSALAARVRAREELGRVIKLEYGSHVLPWNEFFFDYGDYEVLRDYLVAHGQFRCRRGEGRPVAIEVEIDHDRLPSQTRIGDWQVYCVPIHCEGENGVEIQIEPTLYTRDLGFAEKLAQEEHLLICAIPTVTNLKRVAGREFQVVDTRLPLVDRSQVCRIDPP